jgi:nucleotide-binding universal stress UspA family protein
MSLDTVILALGPRDENRCEELADGVLDVVGGTDADVVLLHVFDEGEFDDAVSRLDYDFGTNPAPDEVATRHASVRTVSRLLEDAGIASRVRGAVGDHGEEIVDVADEEGADMVFVGGRRRSPAGKAVFGSTAQYVMLNADCPVTYVRGPEADEED